MIIWLRYDNGTQQSRRFDALDYNALDDADRKITRTLRGTDAVVTLSTRKVYPVTIGADELVVSAAKTFIVSFWTAFRWWISLNPSVTEPDDADFVELTVPTGTIPLERVEDIDELESITMTLTEKRSRL